MTTDDQIRQAREIARDCSGLPNIAEARIDDWNDYGYFSMFVYPEKLQGLFEKTWTGEFKARTTRGTLTRIQHVIKKAGAYFEWADVPKRVYWEDGGRKRFDHYDRDNFKILFRVT